MKCSMESHISHILADLFTARPKAYSENGLRKLRVRQKWHKKRTSVEKLKSVLYAYFLMFFW